jgi:hypothetical protein
MARSAGAFSGRIAVRVDMTPPPPLLRRMCEAASEAYADLRPAWRRLVPRVAEGIRENFSTRGRSLGVPWFPLTRAYIERKRRKGQSSAELLATRRLFNTVTSEQGVLSLTRSSLQFGVRLSEFPQAGALNFGHFDTKQPARPFIFSAEAGVNPATKMAATEELERLSQEILTRLRLGGA